MSECKALWVQLPLSRLFLFRQTLGTDYSNGESHFCRHCQDFYLMAKLLCRQTNASVNILSIPRGLVFYQFASLIHTQAYTHTRRKLFPHHSHWEMPCKDVLILQTRLCWMLSNNNSSSPPSNQPVSLLCVCVWVCVCVWICMIFFLSKIWNHKAQKEFIFLTSTKV